MEIVLCLCCSFHSFCATWNHPGFCHLSNRCGHLICSHYCLACWTCSLFNANLTLVILLRSEALIRIRQSVLRRVCSCTVLVLDWNTPINGLNFDKISFYHSILSDHLHLKTLILIHVRLKLLFCDEEIVLFATLDSYI